MNTLIFHQIKEGLRDSRFLFLAVVIFLAFIINGVIFSDHYHQGINAWRNSVKETTNLLEPRSRNLQEIANFEQVMIKPPSPLAFIAGGEDDKIPNTITVNAFRYRNPEVVTKENKLIPVVPPVDWIFIIGTMMSLLTILLSFNAICGEKKDGTLSLLLSYPVSRLKLFLGKYLGILSVLVLTLLTGVAINLVWMSFAGALPLNEQILTTISLVITISVLYLSLMLLSGMAVSSMVKRPSVALVILLVLWIIANIAIPGLAWLVSEKTIKIPSRYELSREQDAATKAIWESKPDDARNFYRSVFDDNIPYMAEGNNEVLAMTQLINDNAVATQIKQAELTQSLSSFSPFGLLDSTFQKLCVTGVYGFESFYKLTRRYKQQLITFTVETDKKDPTTPHLVWSDGNSTIAGSFSQRPVALSSFPRSHRLWSEGELAPDLDMPFWQIVLFFAGNLVVAGVAFIALIRYDPR